MSSLNLLAHLERGIIKPYKLPKLYNASGKLVDSIGRSTKWFVYYSYRDEQTQKFKRFKEYGKINHLHTIAERTKYANRLIKHFTDLLKKGFNPFIPIEQQAFNEVSTLQQTVQAYLKIKTTTLRPKTLTGYRSALSNLLKWSSPRGLAKSSLQAISAVDLSRYFEYGLAQRKWAATTHNSELMTIRAFFAYWHEQGTISINPAKHIKRLPEQVGLHMAYSDDLIHQITVYLKEQNTAKIQQLYQFIQWLYYTCIRLSELLSLTIGDVRLQSNTILIPARVAKTNRTEPVDISPGLADVIGSMNLEGLPDEWFIFGNQGRGVAGDYCDLRPGPKPLGINYIAKLYRQILQKLGIGQQYTLYGWKHTRNVHLWIQTSCASCAIIGTLTPK